MTEREDRREFRKVFDIPTTQRLLDSGISPSSDVGIVMMQRQTDNLRTVRFFRKATKQKGSFSDRQKEIAGGLTQKRVEEGDISKRLAAIRKRMEAKDIDPKMPITAQPGGIGVLADFRLYDLLRRIFEAEEEEDLEDQEAA